MKRGLTTWSFLAVLGLVASTCGGSYIYLLNLRYLPEHGKGPVSKTGAQAVVGICPFEDVREGMDHQSIGVRYRAERHVDLMRVHGQSVSESVTRAVKEYFISKGFKVTDCKEWDKTPEGLANLAEEISLVVGGKITAFQVQCRSVDLMNTRTNYQAKITAYIGQVARRQVITRTVESEPTVQEFGFDPDEVEEKLNLTLSEAIRKLFE